MPEVKFTRLVSTSSEDPSFTGDNLLKGKKWRCLNGGEQQVSIVLQLEKSVQISNIDIGNNASAFVEIQVARQARPDDFKVILVASSFLTPIESRNESNLTRVRMFPADKLNGEIAKEKWDMIKAVCTQPFNKTLKYGLSFINISSVEEKVEKPPLKEVKLGAFRLKSEDESKDDFKGLFKAQMKPKAKDSLATSLRSQETLASVALQSAEAERKRRASESPKASPQPKKKIVVKKESRPATALPKRNVLEVESPKPSPKPSKKVKKELKTLPFVELMKDVVFTISGFQNPLRGEIRQKGLDMGAKYRGDWDSSCTHLICAFVNTPKFNQVKGKNGKIVKKEWIEKSHSDRKRYPWRQFCLDSQDKGDLSEDEILAQDAVAASSNHDPDYDKDTDDELEEIKNKDTLPSTSKAKASKAKSIYEDDEDDTDDEIEKIKNNVSVKKEDDPYDADTDIDEEEQEEVKPEVETSLPPLPEFFQGKCFFLYGSLKEQLRKSIIRGIVAGGGKIEDYMGPRVGYVITNNEYDKNFKDALEINRDVLFLRPTFIEDCYQAEKCISPSSKHLIIEK